MVHIEFVTICILENSVKGVRGIAMRLIVTIENMEPVLIVHRAIISLVEAACPVMKHERSVIRKREHACPVQMDFSLRMTVVNYALHYVKLVSVKRPVSHAMMTQD